MGTAIIGNILVHTTEQGYEAIMTSGQEGVKLPQALVEIFGLEGLSVEISIDCVAKSAVLAGADEKEKLLVTKITPRHEVSPYLAQNPCVIHTNLDDLSEVRRGTSFGFGAVRTARHFVQLYRNHYGENV